jgi:Regulator of ribonuclease activity B
MASDRDALEELRNVSRMDAVHRVKHYLYLPTRQAADNAAAFLRSRDLAVERPKKTYEQNWLLRVSTSIVPTESSIAELRAIMERAASANGGEYDGWEAEVVS